MRTNRHPLEVTADRIAHDYERYFAKFSPSELIAMENVMQAFQEVVNEERGDYGDE
jgi:hypothetical protein